MRSVAVALLILLVSGYCSTPICANESPTKGITVTFGSGQSVLGYLVLPSGGGEHAAIIVFHENWGVTDWIKEQTEELAAQGYVALAIDLYHGKATNDPSQGAEMSHALSLEGAYRDSISAFTYLAARKDVDPKRIGDIGWGMGGRYALQLAVHEPRLASAVVNYGMPPTDPSDIEKIEAPMLVIYGGADPSISIDKIHAFEKAMKASAKRIDVKIYDDASHSFQNPGNKKLYRPEDTEDAMRRISAFLANTLK